MSLASFQARKNLRADWFATLCMVLGVALGTATVNVVLALDANTRRLEAGNWTTDPDLAPELGRTVTLTPLGTGQPTGAPSHPAPPPSQDVLQETHEDYQVMRSAIRLGSLSAFLVGALIVFFSLAVVIEHRRREVALLRSLGATARQVAAIFVREAAWVGAAGAVLGFLGAIPLTWLAARIGITTTGRAHISSLVFPWSEMLAVSLIGGATALLGVVPPLRKLLKLKVSETLRPRFLDDDAARARRGWSSGVALIVVPMTLLVYGLMRPLFRELLPSLAFLVLEAALVTTLLLALLTLVPDLTRVVGGALARVFLHGPAAARLLATRRIRRQGHELAWSVGGVMLVFALLLSLHISTHALKAEVTRFGETALADRRFLYTEEQRPIPSDVLAAIPAGVTVTRYSARTPWPNAVSAVARADLQALARDLRKPELSVIAERFDENGVILSTLMARRLGLSTGDRLELSSPSGKRTLSVTAVTDAIGFVPMIATYRSSKTYAVVEAANYALLAPFASPIGSALVLTETGAVPSEAMDWDPLHRVTDHRDVLMTSGWRYEQVRRRETNKDFFIFDVILLLTSVLAAIGVANQLILAVHTRRRELALLRVLGMTADQLRKMLLLEGAFVGLLGGAMAVLLGVPLGLGSVAALKLVSAFEVPFELPWFYPMLTVAGAVSIALLAALYPAHRAASARSAEFVHYE